MERLKYEICPDPDFAEILFAAAQVALKGRSNAIGVYFTTHPYLFRFRGKRYYALTNYDGTVLSVFRIGSDGYPVYIV